MKEVTQNFTPKKNSPKQLKPSPRISSDIKCDQCEYVAASEKGLRQHIRMKHKKEELRTSHEGPLNVSISPLLDASREEPSHNIDAKVSPLTTVAVQSTRSRLFVQPGLMRVVTAPERPITNSGYEVVAGTFVVQNYLEYICM